ncbi:MAG: hypothetical protein HXX15_14005 [Rhodopseudomonas sp.]|uniref:hypothetical protein n=1 Tax=Rhodopseudomonas sp. TaxID=1078 RepID=UPI00178E3B5E|nr:hypothetical protein [Rhodopseudomonas sp.]NVN87190.1 hypothetical protein [Rhodopseudomonas sp.]
MDPTKSAPWTAARRPAISIASPDNYSGAESLTAGRALADALGRFGSHGVRLATHWGSLTGFLSEAYRLYREPDEANERFGDFSLSVEHPIPGLAVYAARARQGDRLQIVVINKTADTIDTELSFRSARKFRLADLLGFDAEHRHTMSLDIRLSDGDDALVVNLPPWSARRYAFAGL